MALRAYSCLSCPEHHPFFPSRSPKVSCRATPPNPSIHATAARRVIFGVSHQKVPQCPAASAQPVQTMRIRKFPRPEPIVVQALNQCQPFIGIFCRGSERHRLAFLVPLRAEHVAQPVGLIAQRTDLAHSHPRPAVRFMVDFKAAKFGNNVHPSTSCRTTASASRCLNKSS